MGALATYGRKGIGRGRWLSMVARALGGSAGYVWCQGPFVGALAKYGGEGMAWGAGIRNQRKGRSGASIFSRFLCD